MRFPWSELGIAPTGEARAIRSAYAARIKTMDLDADVAGYARLREARDVALRLAKTIAAGDVPAADDEDLPEHEDLDWVPFDPFADEPAPPGWLHAAPTLSGQWQADPALSARPATPDGELIGRISPLIGADSGVADDAIAPAGVDPFTAPLVEGHEQSASVGPEALQSPFARLAAMLDPEGAAGLAPLSEAEEAQALGLLRAVLDIVHHSDITGQDEMETWLAQLFAESWPRSAPLLDETEAAFEWNREWGKVDARPAIEYLGARLRGYRFQRKVAENGHRYHKAWVELGRPGKAGPLRFLRAGGADVRGLLAGIRRHFPEVEEHLDAERVASWEKGSTWPTVAIVVVGLILLGFLFGLDDPKSRTRASGGAEFAAEMRAIEGASNFALPQALGPGFDMTRLRRERPDLARPIEALSRAAVQSGSADAQADAAGRIVAFVRQRTYLNGRTTTGEDFDRTMRLRLGLLEAAKAKDAAACVRYLNSGELPADVAVPEDVRASERSLAASFAGRGLLGAPIPSGPTRATVPGALVGKVLKATKLGKEEVAQAMQGKGSDTNRCAVSIALLDATLDWKGDGRRAILLTL
ncbi:MAG TPA: hypothetical protein VMQ93_15545 [Novosphingobium sp.]|nr:hypothetical protein [Novosphingobium sp.]